MKFLSEVSYSDGEEWMFRPAGTAVGQYDKENRLMAAVFDRIVYLFVGRGLIPLKRIYTILF